MDRKTTGKHDPFAFTSSKDRSEKPSLDRRILEQARAREIYITYCYNQDKEAVRKHVEGSEKHYGKDSGKRILMYIKQMRAGELQ